MGMKFPAVVTAVVAALSDFLKRETLEPTLANPVLAISQHHGGHLG